MCSIQMNPAEVVFLKRIGKIKSSLIITRWANIYDSGEKTVDAIDVLNGDEIFDVRPEWLITINEELN